MRQVTNQYPTQQCIGLFVASLKLEIFTERLNAQWVTPAISVEALRSLSLKNLEHILKSTIRKIMAGIKHWLEDPSRERKFEHEHINMPRISATNMLKLIQLKNSMLGIKRSLYEESVISEERGETYPI